ncbi:MAG: hypothetical protein LBB81_01420 [Treponema sp.]|jgi:hypothetical protein|nr:hypothetical protein [Treponema sp.]
MKKHYKFVLHYELDIPDNLTDEEERDFVVTYIFNDLDTGNYKSKIPVSNSSVRLWEGD